MLPLKLLCRCGKSKHLRYPKQYSCPTSLHINCLYAIVVYKLYNTIYIYAYMQIETATCGNAKSIWDLHNDNLPQGSYFLPTSYHTIILQNIFIPIMYNYMVSANCWPIIPYHNCSETEITHQPRRKARLTHILRSCDLAWGGTDPPGPRSGTPCWATG